MPAGSALPPGRLPVRLARLGCFPQRKVQRILFLLTYGNASAALQVFNGLVRQLAVTLVLAGTEIHITVNCVGVAFLL